MRPLVALALAALLTASLPGCADDKERYPDGVPAPSNTRTATQGSGSTGSATSTSTTTNGPGGDANLSPTGTISVAINGTNATFTLTGSDPDDDPLVWDLDFGDGNATNGTSLPTMVNHTYVPSNATGKATGNLTAVFTLSDGAGNVAYNVTVALGGGGSSKLTQIVTGSTAVPNPAATELACVRDDVDGNIYELDPADVGWPYVLEPGDGTFGVFFWAGETYISGSTDATGVVPEGAEQIEVCNVTGAPMASYTVTLTEP